MKSWNDTFLVNRKSSILMLHSEQAAKLVFLA